MSETIPRLTNGRRLYPIGPGYMAMIGTDGSEASERGTGQIWVGFTGVGGGVQMVFHPDSTDEDGNICLRATATSREFGLYAEGDGIVTRTALDGYATARKGTEVTIHWRDMLDAML